MTWSALPRNVQLVALTNMTALEREVFVFELGGKGRRYTAQTLQISESYVKSLRNSAWAKIGRALLLEAMSMPSDGSVE